MKNKKLIKSVGAILVILFLGAIGSGLWSELLSPACNWIIDKIIRGISSVSTAFKDQIYRESSKGFHEEHSLYILMLIMGFIAAFYISLLIVEYITRLEKTKETKEKINYFIFSNKFFVLYHFMLIILIIALFFQVIKATYSNKITMKSLNSIEIISPFISSKDSQLLKSEYLQIKKCMDYEIFYDKMKDLSEKHNIELPLFKPL